MIEVLYASWLPGSQERILVRSPHGELEWFLGPFRATFGPEALAHLQRVGHAKLRREARGAVRVLAA